MTWWGWVLIVVGMVVLAPASVVAVPSSFDWQSIPVQSGEVANIVVSPTNPDVMYLGVEVNAHSAYKSTDRGKSWTRILSYDHAKDVAVHPTNPEIAFLADSQHLMRTTTGGRGVPRTGEGARNAHGEPPSFGEVLVNDSSPGPAESSFSSIVSAPSNPSRWYTSVRGAQGRGHNNFGEIRSRLWESTDTGATWRDVGGTYPETILVLAVDPSDEHRILIGAEDGIYQSTDGGRTTEKLAGADHVPDVKTIDGKSWLAASLEGIYRSTDGGASWTLITKGLPDRRVLRVAVVRDDPSIAWATTMGGVARSTDGGASWTSVTGDLPATNLQALAVDPTNSNLAIVATEAFTFSVRSEFRLFQQGQYSRQGIYRTEDGGQHWQRSDAGLIEENLIDITTHPTRPYEVWVSQQASRGLYRSRDAGQTWSLSPHLLTHYPMRTILAPNSDRVVHTSLHIGEDFGISDDSGVNWQITSQDTFFDVLKRGRGHDLFDSSKTDGGNLHLHGVAVDPTSPDVIYVGSVDDPSQYNRKPVSGAHVFKSTDGGTSWAESDEGYDHAVATSINDIKIDPKAPSTLYLGTTKKESTQGNGLWKSVDAAANWSRSNRGMSDDTSVSTIAIHPERTNELVAATYNGFYRSTDGGATWTQVMHGTFKDVEVDPSSPDVVYTGSGFEGGPVDGPQPDKGKEGMFVSTDFGATWRDITGSLPTGKVATVGVNSTGTIVYAGVEGHGLFAAVDPAVGPVPADPQRGNQLGSEHDSGLRGKDGPGNAQWPQLFGGPPGSDEPPPRIKALILGGGLLLLTAITLLVRWLLHRHSRPTN